jgi:hypothetical protein
MQKYLSLKYSTTSRQRNTANARKFKKKWNLSEVNIDQILIHSQLQARREEKKK